MNMKNIYASLLHNSRRTHQAKVLRQRRRQMFRRQLQLENLEERRLMAIDMPSSLYIQNPQANAVLSTSDSSQTWEGSTCNQFKSPVRTCTTTSPVNIYQIQAVAPDGGKAVIESKSGSSYPDASFYPKNGLLTLATGQREKGAAFGQQQEINLAYDPFPAILGDFEYSDTSKKYITSFVAPASGSFTFYVKHHGSGNIKVGSESKFFSTGPAEDKVTVTLSAGSVVPFELVYNSSGLHSSYRVLSVDWEGPGLARRSFSPNNDVVWERNPGFGNGPIDRGILSDRAYINADKSLRETYYGLRYTTSVTVPASGEYTFFLHSDFSGQLKLDGQVVLTQQNGTESSVKRTYAAGATVQIEILYHHHFGNRFLKFDWSGPNLGRQAFKTTALVKFDYMEGNFDSAAYFSSVSPKYSQERYMDAGLFQLEWKGAKSSVLKVGDSAEVVQKAINEISQIKNRNGKVLVTRSSDGLKYQVSFGGDLWFRPDLLAVASRSLAKVKAITSIAITKRDPDAQFKIGNLSNTFSVDIPNANTITIDNAPYFTPEKLAQFRYNFSGYYNVATGMSGYLQTPSIGGRFDPVYASGIQEVNVETYTNGFRVITRLRSDLGTLDYRLNPLKDASGNLRPITLFTLGGLTFEAPAGVPVKMEAFNDGDLLFFSTTQSSMIVSAPFEGGRLYLRLKANGSPLFKVDLATGNVAVTPSYEFVSFEIGGFNIPASNSFKMSFDKATEKFTFNIDQLNLMSAIREGSPQAYEVHDDYRQVVQVFEKKFNITNYSYRYLAGNYRYSDLNYVRDIMLPRDGKTGPLRAGMFSVPQESYKSYIDYYAIAHTVKITVPRSGEYTFSADGFGQQSIRVNGAVLANGGSGNISGKVQLIAGSEYEIEFTELNDGTRWRSDMLFFIAGPATDGQTMRLSGQIEGRLNGIASETYHSGKGLSAVTVDAVKDAFRDAIDKQSRLTPEQKLDIVDSAKISTSNGKVTITNIPYLVKSDSYWITSYPNRLANPVKMLIPRGTITITKGKLDEVKDLTVDSFEFGATIIGSDLKFSTTFEPIKPSTAGGFKTAFFQRNTYNNDGSVSVPGNTFGIYGNQTQLPLDVAGVKLNGTANLGNASSPGVIITNAEFVKLFYPVPEVTVGAMRYTASTVGSAKPLTVNFYPPIGNERYSYVVQGGALLKSGSTLVSSDLKANFGGFGSDGLRIFPVSGKTPATFTFSFGVADTFLVGTQAIQTVKGNNGLKLVYDPITKAYNFKGNANLDFNPKIPHTANSLEFTGTPLEISATVPDGVTNFPANRLDGTTLNFFFGENASLNGFQFTPRVSNNPLRVSITSNSETIGGSFTMRLDNSYLYGVMDTTPFTGAKFPTSGFQLDFTPVPGQPSGFTVGGVQLDSARKATLTDAMVLKFEKATFQGTELATGAVGTEPAIVEAKAGKITKAVITRNSAVQVGDIKFDKFVATYNLAAIPAFWSFVGPGKYFNKTVSVGTPGANNPQLKIGGELGKGFQLKTINEPVSVLPPSFQLPEVIEVAGLKFETSELPQDEPVVDEGANGKTFSLKSGNYAVKLGNTTIRFNVGLKVKVDSSGVSIVSFSATGVQNSAFTIGNATFQVETLTVDYVPAERTLNISGKARFTFKAGSANVDLAVTLGTKAEPGLVIKNGALESLKVTVDGTFELLKLSIAAESLTIAYHKENSEFAIYGGVKVSTAEQGGVQVLKDFAVTLGSEKTPGIKVVDGRLEALDIAINGDINLFKLTAKSKNLRVRYTAAENQLQITGALSITLANKLTLEASLPGDGLLIDTNTGKVQIRGVGLKAQSNINFGAMTIKGLHLEYEESSSGEVSISAGAEIEFPSGLAVGGSFKIVQGKLEAISISFEKNPGILVANGLVNIYRLEVAVEGLSNLDNFMFKGTVKATVGPLVKFGGEAYALADVTGTITITTKELSLEGDVQLVGGHFGNGKFKGVLAWDNVARVTFDAEVNLYPGDVIRGTIKAYADIGGNVDFNAKMGVYVPRGIPLAGGASLGQLGVELRIRPAEEPSASYAKFSFSDIAINAFRVPTFHGSARIGFDRLVDYNFGARFYIPLPWPFPDIDYSIDVGGRFELRDSDNPTVEILAAASLSGTPNAEILFASSSVLPDETFIDLYADHDALGNDGLLIASGIPYSAGTQSFVWHDMSTFANPGEPVFVYAVINDGTHPLGYSSYSPQFNVASGFTPTIASPAKIFFMAGDVATFASTLGNAIAIDDPRKTLNPNSEIEVVLSVGHGMIDLSHAPDNVTYSGAASNRLTLRGRAHDITAALDGLYYVQEVATSSPDELTITVRNMPLQNLGIAATATVTLDPSPVSISFDADQSAEPATLIEIGHDDQTPLANLSINATNGEYLSGATISIVGYEMGEDSLRLPLDEELALGIESWFDHESGTLTLSGFDWTIDYEQALQSVIFSTTSSNNGKSLAISVSDDNGEISQTAIPLDIIQGHIGPELLMSIAGTSYVEDSGEIQLDPESWLTVADGNQVESLVVEFLGEEYVSGDDVLSFAGSNIQGNFDSLLGRLELTGQASAAEWAAALGQIRYESTAATFSEGYRYLRFSLHDNSGEENGSTFVDYVIEKVATLSAHPSPFITLAQSDLTFPANDDYLSISQDLVLGANAPNLLVAYVTISENYIEGEDELAVGTLWDGMTSQFDTSTGTLTIRGTASLFEYEDVLRSIYFVDHAGFRTPGPVGITFQVFDGLSLSDRASLLVNIEAAPFLATSLDNVLVYESGRESDALGLQVEVEYIGTINSAAIAFVAGYESNQDTLKFVDQNGLTGTFDANTGVLNITGNGSSSDYKEAIESIVYRNSRYNPVAGDRVLSITVKSGGVESNEVYALISVEPEIVAPNVSLGVATAFTEDGAPVAVVPDFDLSQRDGNSEFLAAPDMLYGVEVTILNYVDGEDYLLIQTSETISGEFDTAEGRIYLTGSASFAEYETMLRTLEYRNTSDAPTLVPRQISIRLLDSGGNGLAAQSFVTQVVVGLPDPVTKTAGDITNVNGLQNSGAFSLGLDDLTFTSPEVDSAQVELRFTALSLPPSSLGKVLQADGSQLEEEVSYPLDVLPGLRFEPAPGAFGFADVEFSVALYDLETKVADDSSFLGRFTVTVEGIATITENQAYVAQVYRELFDKNPTAGVLSTYTAKYEELLQRVDRSDEGYIDDNEARHAFVGWIESTIEYRTQQISQLYADALGRIPTSTELAGHLFALEAGKSLTDVTAAVLGSDEFFGLNNSQGFTSFVNALYSQIWGRNATSSELGSATKKLQNGMSNLAFATEVLQQHLLSNDAMEDTVTRLLHRDYQFADQFSFDFANLETVVQSIISSDEYFDTFAVPLTSMQMLTGETNGYLSVGKLGDISGQRAGGTLIGHKHVLVAAHSVVGIPPGQLSFTLGSETYRVSKVNIHPDFDMEAVGSNDGNDIAILELDRIVNGVTPTPILGRTPQLGEQLLLVGYGEHNGDKFGTKRAGWTPPVDQVERNVFRWTQENLLQNDSDPGDSGSPLLVTVNGLPHVLGIVSGGTSNFEGLGDIATNTRMDRYTEWLKSIVSDVVVTSVTSTPSLLIEQTEFFLDENAGEQAVAIEFAGEGPLSVSVSTDQAAFFSLLTVDHDSSGRGVIRFETGLNQRGTAQIHLVITAGGTSVSRSLKLTVTERNDPPTIDPLDLIYIDVGSSVRTLMLSGVSAGIGETGATQTRLLQSIPAGFFAELTLVDGNTSVPKLRYQPRSDSTGSAGVYIEVRDAGNDGIFDTLDDNTRVETFGINTTLTSSPTLDAVVDTTLALSAGSRTIALSGISDGDLEVQELRFSLSTTDASIADALVHYDGANEATTGSLIIEPLAAGTATITVTIIDTGDDGVFETSDDRSFSRSFVLTVLAGPNSWHNSGSPHDVNNDGFVSAIDALVVINHLNRFGAIELPLTGSDGLTLVDTTNDRFLNATDALLVINYLNRRSRPTGASGEGERSGELEARVESEDSLVQWLAVPNTTESEWKPVIAKLIGPSGGTLSAGSRKSTLSVDRSIKTVVQSPPASEVAQSLQALTDAAIEELDFELDWDLFQHEPLRA
jgi:hypothetical protein